MAKGVIIAASTGATLAGGTFTWSWPSPGFTIAFTEAWAAAKVFESVTFSNMRLSFGGGNDGGGTLTFRDTGGAGSQSVSKSAGSGDAEDSTNTDSLTSGDTFDWNWNDSGSNPTQWIMAVNYEFASGYGGWLGTRAGGGFALANSMYAAMYGINVNAVSATTLQHRNRAYDSWESMETYVSANTRTSTVTIYGNIAGTDTTANISISAGSTGLFTTTGMGESVSDGDLLSYHITAGTDLFKSCTSQHLFSILKSTAERQELIGGYAGGISRAASATANYLPLAGYLNTLTDFSSDADARMKLGYATTVGSLRTYISANSYTGTATIKLYAGGSPQITLSIGSGVTGHLENTSDTYAAAATDELSYEIDEGTSGNLTFMHIALTTNMLTDYTLAVAAGSYTATGTAASLEYHRAVQASAGSYALSGQSVNFLYDRIFPVDAGSIILTGQDANLEVHRILSAAAGSYSLVGSDATLTFDRVVSAEAGSYTYTGQDAVLGTNIPIIAEAGSYTISGQSVNFLIDRNLTAEVGSYDVSGQDANLEYARVVVAEAGSYAITGSDVSLEYHRVLAAASTNIDLTGQDATLTLDRTVQGETGAYALSGASVTLRKSNILLAGAGSYALTEGDSTLRYGAYESGFPTSPDWSAGGAAGDGWTPESEESPGWSTGSGKASSWTPSDEETGDWS